MSEFQPMSLLQLNLLLQKLVSSPPAQNVWLTAELSDVQVRGGHCYMELLDKDEQGRITAKARAVIWVNAYRYIAAQFAAATGRDFATGIKVMVRASAAMHPVYGLSLVISEVNAAYTLGDKERRRREILDRLKREGVIDNNRRLAVPAVAQRVAVVSARGAAGYGDFINQLFGNRSRLRFDVRLFEAVMQGASAPASIVAALDAVALKCDEFDCVVIIRGGGATSDLECYESYELARAVAMLPLPVIIGIGHERDVTLLDFVANMRVKTPTAAAEWLVSSGDAALTRLDSMALSISSYVQRRIAGEGERLTWFRGQLLNVAARRLEPERTRIGMMASRLGESAMQVVARERERIESSDRLAAVLSPRATLRRGFSYTQVAGGTLRSIGQVERGVVIRTVTADGVIDSQVLSAHYTKR